MSNREGIWSIVVDLLNTFPSRETTTLFINCGARISTRYLSYLKSYFLDLFVLGSSNRNSSGEKVDPTLIYNFAVDHFLFWRTEFSVQYRWCLTIFGEENNLTSSGRENESGSPDQDLYFAPNLTSFGRASWEIFAFEVLDQKGNLRIVTNLLIHLWYNCDS